MTFNPLSKYLLSKLALRRGLSIVSIEGRTIVVRPNEDGRPGHVLAAIEALTLEFNLGATNSPIIVKLHEPGFIK